MLQQIISHTPTYVWAILGFLIYRGAVAARDRSVSIRSVFIIPLAMLALGMQSTSATFGLATPAGAAWLAGLVSAAVLAWRVSGPIVVNRAAGTVQLRGSWAPLAFMMGIFIGKFALAVMLAMQPALRDNLVFTLFACAAFGTLSGAFMGRPLRVAAAQ